jgi:hypothetical protein
MPDWDDDEPRPPMRTWVKFAITLGIMVVLYVLMITTGEGR